MTKWNCVLKFSDDMPTELRKLRKPLLFGYLIGARKANKAMRKKEAPDISQLQYIPGLLGVETKFYLMGYPTDPLFIIFQNRSNIFVPDLRDKRVFTCFVKLLIHHKMIQFRRPFISDAKPKDIAYFTYHVTPMAISKKDTIFWSNRFGRYREEKRFPKRQSPLGLITSPRLSLNKKIYRWYARKDLQEVFRNSKYESRNITKHDIKVLWEWLKLGKFTEYEITWAIVDKYGIEVKKWIDQLSIK